MKIAEPQQQHYLPRSYLVPFEIPEKPGYIFFYQKKVPPTVVNIGKVARKRHLYTFDDKEGNRSFAAEEMLGVVESATKVILDQLNGCDGPLSISAEKQGTLAVFVAFQAVRTPAHLNNSRRVYGDMHKATINILASNKEAFHHTAKQARESGIDMPEDPEEIEKARKFALEGEYRIDVEESPYFLGQSFDMAFNSLYPCILHKQPTVLRSSEAVFLTSDHPVALLPDPKLPRLYRGGFANSDVFFPIGNQTALHFRTGVGPSPPENPAESVILPFIRLRPFQARQYNRLTIANAEDYLFTSEANSAVEELFNSTTKPRRVHVANPLEKKE